MGWYWAYYTTDNIYYRLQTTSIGNNNKIKIKLTIKRGIIENGREQ